VYQEARIADGSSCQFDAAFFYFINQRIGVLKIVGMMRYGFNSGVNLRGKFHQAETRIETIRRKVRRYDGHINITPPAYAINRV
jgi:hypothetical protein